MTRVTWCTLSVGAALAVGGCAAGGVGEEGGGLVTTSATTETGFAATLRLDGEEILVESKTGTDVRRTIVRSAGGRSYADWTINLADFDISGTIGGRWFGRFEDRETDMDPAYWTEVNGSHAGDVLRAVSPAVQDLIDEGVYAPIEADLVPLAKMAGYLAKLAMPEAELTAAGDIEYGAECNFYNWPYDSYISFCPAGSGYWVGRRHGRTGPGTGYWYESCASCTRTYYIQMWDGAGHLLAADARTSCTALLEGGFDSSLYRGRCVTRNSKHWDTYVPARWRYHSWCAPNYDSGTPCG